MTDNSHEEVINYELLVEDSLRTVVRSALAIVAHEGLPGETHFYISFKTNHEDVVMDKKLKAANPDEMTIVLQHQFWDLEVTEFDFSVGLSFSGVQQILKIPFAAITHFTDPSVGFGLQFSENDAENTVLEAEKDSDSDPKSTPALAVAEKQEKSENGADSAEIVSLENFRNKSEN